jgi:hypothetical protein
LVVQQGAPEAWPQSLSRTPVGIVVES